MSVNDQDGNPALGDIEFNWRDGGTPNLQFDRLAHSGRSELLFVSLITDTQRIKQLRAALCGADKDKGYTTATAGGVKTRQAGAEDYYASTPGRLKQCSDGYTVYQHKLGYGMAHAMFVTKMPGFMRVITPESLWQELNSARFTTPILKSWMGYIETRLREENRLEDAHCFNCACGVLSATTKKLDEIVSAGLQQGHLLIQEETAA